MSLWPSWWRRRKVPLPEPVAAAVRTWEATPAADEHARPADTRFVVVDTETTGLDPARAELLAIGACAIVDEAVDLSSHCEVGVRPSAPSTTGNVLVHQIGHGRQALGQPLDAALAEWLAYCGRPVFVGFHARFDATVLARHARAALGIALPARWLDVGLLLRALYPGEGPSHPDLDYWARRFALPAAGRHGALADAYLTATLFLVILRAAPPRHVATVSQLFAWQDATRDRVAVPEGQFPGA